MRPVRRAGWPNRRTGTTSAARCTVTATLVAEFRGALFSVPVTFTVVVPSYSYTLSSDTVSVTSVLTAATVTANVTLA